MVEHPFQFRRITPEGHRSQHDQQIASDEPTRQLPVIVVDNADPGGFQPAPETTAAVANGFLPQNDMFGFISFYRKKFSKNSGNSFTRGIAFGRTVENQRFHAALLSMTHAITAPSATAMSAQNDSSSAMSCSGSPN